MRPRSGLGKGRPGRGARRSPSVQSAQPLDSFYLSSPGGVPVSQKEPLRHREMKGSESATGQKQS